MEGGDETTACPRCGHKMPPANLTMHLIRCTGGGSSASTATTDTAETKETTTTTTSVETTAATTAAPKDDLERQKQQSSGDYNANRGPSDVFMGHRMFSDDTGGRGGGGAAGGSSSSTSVPCPICSSMFEPDQIERHAAFCDGTPQSSGGSSYSRGGRGRSDARGGGGGGRAGRGGGGKEDDGFARGGGEDRYDRPEGGTCLGGCGFHGNDNNGGYCSLCFKKLFGSGGGGPGRGRGGGAPGVDPAYKGGGARPKEPIEPLKDVVVRIGAAGDDEAFEVDTTGDASAATAAAATATAESASNKKRRVIVIRHANLVLEDADAIVNPANSKLDHASGVAGDIVRWGGEIIQDLSRIYIVENGPDVAPGTAMVTPGGLLKCKHVIHAVGPMWRGGNEGEEFLLGSAVLASLQIASELGLRSIAIPAISSGIFGFPKELCAKLLFAEVFKFFDNYPSSSVEEVRFTNLDADTVLIFQSAIPRPAEATAVFTLPNKRTIEVFSGASQYEFGGHRKCAFVEAINGIGEVSQLGGGNSAEAEAANKEVHRNILAAMERVMLARKKDKVSIEELSAVGSIDVFPVGSVFECGGIGGAPLLATVCPVFDLNVKDFELLKRAVRSVIECDNVKRSETKILVLPYLGTGRLFFPPELSIRAMIEGAYEALSAAKDGGDGATPVKRVVICQPKQGVEQCVLMLRQRISPEGELLPGPELALESGEKKEKTPPPADETSKQKRERERREAEENFQRRQAMEQKRFMKE